MPPDNPEEEAAEMASAEPDRMTRISNELPATTCSGARVIVAVMRACKCMDQDMRREQKAELEVGRSDAASESSLVNVRASQQAPASAMNATRAFSGV